ncbi:hypothetical protein AB0C87_38555, partial [Actinomadura sp. NPDC048021]
RIADPPDFNLQSSVQLGLFVVSKLAERYNLQVSLKRSAYGGTTAVVVIPRELIVEQGPAQVPAGTTTTNGLEVRRPAAALAASGVRSASPTTTLPPAGTGPQHPAPALVAVPPPAADPLPVRPPGGAPAPEPEAPTPARHDDPADGARPDPIEPEDLPPVPDISTTPSGLPVRVPQANLAEPLRTDEPAVADEQDEQEDPGRSPEEIQRIMGSYQRGTQRGRVDAAEALGTNAAEGEADQ